MNEIKSIGISGILKINTHDLNNEGTEGNIPQERKSVIIDENDEMITVNAISGDMMKHSVSNYINDIAKEKGLNLCAGCRINDANRINVQSEDLEGEEDEELIDEIIQLCASDDLNGFMNTDKNINRSSCYETGVINGIPDKVNTESDFHTKYSRKETKRGEDADGTNLGQNIFYRPNNSGKYATVMFINVCQIGKNNYTHEYAISEEDRKKRLETLLKAIMSSYTNFKGAQRNTMHPHITDFQGVVSLSKSMFPAPNVSALNENYIDEIKGIAENINTIEEDSIEIKEFSSISEFTEIIVDLI